MIYQKFIFSFFLLCIQNLLWGQSYFSTGGIRLGTDYGLSFKQRILKKTTVEGILFSTDNGKSNLGFAIVATKHKPILTRNFNIFYGAGLTKHWTYTEKEEGTFKYHKWGIPIQAGLEFTIGRINLSWDYTPILYFSGLAYAANGPAFSSLKGLSVRYVFINKKEGKRILKKIKSPFGKRKK